MVRSSTVYCARASMAASMVAWRDAWSSGCTCSRKSWSIGMVTAPSRPKMAAQRSSQSMTPRRRSTSQMPTELASRATSSRASDVPIAVLAAASSSSATTEAPSWSSSCASSSVHCRGSGVVDGQHADDVPGLRHQRGAEVGLHLAGGHRGQVGDARVLARRRDREGPSLADGDGGEGAGQQRGTAHDARREPVSADDGVLVGEDRDLRVPHAEQARGQGGEAVVGGRAGHLHEQAAGGGDAVRILEGVDLGHAGSVRGGHATPPHPS